MFFARCIFLISDSIHAKDSLSDKQEEIETEESYKESTEKPTVQEQIKKQVEQKNDTVASKPNGLTKIEKGDKTEKKDDNRLTPIKDKMKKEPVDNPLTPTNPKKDNINENPLNNQ